MMFDKLTRKKMEETRQYTEILHDFTQKIYTVHCKARNYWILCSEKLLD
jgi:hypothetical protein